MIVKLASVKDLFDALQAAVSSHASEAGNAITKGGAAAKDIASEVLDKVKANPELQKTLQSAATHTAAAGAGFAAGTANQISKNKEKLKTLLPLVGAGGVAAGVVGASALKHKEK